LKFAQWAREQIAKGVEVGRSERESFVEKEILNDIKIRKANTEQWKNVQASYKSVTYDEWKVWQTNVWSSWVRHKLKYGVNLIVW
jgi:hypothetical protein